MMEAFIPMQHYPNDPSCPVIPPTEPYSGEPAETASSSPSLTEEAASDTLYSHADAPETSGSAAGLAVPSTGPEADAEAFSAKETVSRDTDKEVDAILAEVAQKRETEQHSTGTGSKASSGKRRSAAAPNTGGAKSSASGGKKKRRKRKPFSFVDVLKYIFPWRGDSGLEAARKIIFVAAMAVFSVCLFLIGDYYVGLHKDRKEYDSIQQMLEDTRNNRHYSNEGSETKINQGGVTEYLEENEVAVLRKDNPDVIGYITIEGTKVSYPVVQKKSADPNENTNDYYLNRNFYQESSKSGCIFMDFRCHFDEVADHRRAVKNSDNLIIYGHNMRNESMFGSLRNYTRNYSLYSQHPIVTLQSLYETYTYKIFSIFIVDGEDYTSPYAFNCWNTLDFSDETEFYDYVNNAKKRNIIANDVDVVYGDQILTLYTCNSQIDNGKLILMCRMVRPGEDPRAGTENGHLSDNILYPQAYYKYHKETFDITKFVPYGPTDN